MANASNIQTLDDVVEALSKLGYSAKKTEDGSAVLTAVGGPKQPFSTVITQDENQTHLTINCQVAASGQINEDAKDDFLVSALDANTRLAPFSIALITASDGHEGDDDFPIVLTNRIPVGDLSIGELEAAMNSLLRAIMGARETLEVGLGKAVTA